MGESRMGAWSRSWKLLWDCHLGRCEGVVKMGRGGASLSNPVFTVHSCFQVPLW